MSIVKKFIRMGGRIIPIGAIKRSSDAIKKTKSKAVYHKSEAKDAMGKLMDSRSGNHASGATGQSTSGKLDKIKNLFKKKNDPVFTAIAPSERGKKAKSLYEKRLNRHMDAESNSYKRIDKLKRIRNKASLDVSIAGAAFGAGVYKRSKEK